MLIFCTHAMALSQVRSCESFRVRKQCTIFNIIVQRNFMHLYNIRKLAKCNRFKEKIYRRSMYILTHTSIMLNYFQIDVFYILPAIVLHLFIRWSIFEKQLLQEWHFSLNIQQTVDSPHTYIAIPTYFSSCFVYCSTHMSYLIIYSIYFTALQTFKIRCRNRI